MLQHDFSLIRGIRELRDGRILVSDQAEKSLVVADFRSGTVRQIGREGSGPKEYLLPGRLIALPGDTTLLLDAGNARLSVIAPTLDIVRHFSNQRPGTEYALSPTGADAEGRLYFEVPAWANRRAEPGDTVTVVRWNMYRDRIDTVGRIKGITPLYSRSTPGMAHVIFAPQDVWQVAPNGDVAFVRVADFHVDWRRANGTVSRGPAVPFRALPVTAADKHAYVRREMEGALTSGRGTGLTALSSRETSEDEIRRMVPNQTYAAMRPPFVNRAPKIDDAGMLWVERSVPLSSPPTFDRFDNNGRHVGTMTLPAGRNLFTFGRGVVYAVATDGDGIHHVERYRLPVNR